MKLRKLLGVVVAVAMFSVLAISASAGIINGNGPDFEEGDSKYVFALTADEVLGATSVTVSITVDGVEDGFGGGIAILTPDWPGSWIEWGDADAGKPIVSDGSTIVITGDDLFTENEEGKYWVMLEGWWGGDITVDGITIELAEVAPVAPPEALVTTPEVAPVNTGATEADKQETDTGLGDVAIASAIALAAAGAVVFSRKKK
ncbi:MAG: hypothetical protein FWG70_04845 [Oscillospiraceae bacterium]|nr:hypothetical protein [Oscillospiraceae bacterium]